jgi:MFS family permease
MTQKQFGDTMAVMACASFVAMTFWSSLADYTSRHKLVLMTTSLSLGISFQLLLIPINNPTGEKMFYFFCFLLYGFIYGGILPLTDYQALKMIEAIPGVGKEMYGRQRMFGSMGYGLTSLLVGILVDWFGAIAINYVQLTCSLLFCIFVFFSTESDKRPIIEMKIEEINSKTNLKVEEKEKSPESPKQLHEVPPSDHRRPIVILLTNLNFVFLLFSVFLMGIARSVMNAFLALFLADYLNIKATKTGLAVCIGMLSSSAVFYPGAWLIQNVGVYWMLIAAQTLVALRCWAYTFIPHSPSYNWMMYVVEILNGLSTGLTQVSGVKIAIMTAPKGLEATALGLYVSMYTQLPVIVSTFFGGRVYDAKGPVFLFLITAILSTITLVLVFCKYLFERKIFYS